MLKFLVHSPNPPAVNPRTVFGLLSMEERQRFVKMADGCFVLKIFCLVLCGELRDIDSAVFQQGDAFQKDAAKNVFGKREYFELVDDRMGPLVMSCSSMQIMSAEDAIILCRTRA
uniref:Cyclic nucleotide-binding domain-containing protein n=1 Tax=Steinernema glaseri TaxID=37863 RepID=A0A1I8A230_9BILA